MSRPALRPVAAAALALLAPGCGAARLHPADISRPYTLVPPAERTYPQAGLRFQAPGDWSFGAGPAPLVTSTSSGSATVAVWRYVRTEPLPRTRAALTAAQQQLVQAAQARDPHFALKRARRTQVDGAPAIELTGTEVVAGRPREVRSTHVYAKGAEVVVDQFAAPRDFAEIDRVAFRPLVASLKIDPPAA